MIGSEVRKIGNEVSTIGNKASPWAPECAIEAAEQYYIGEEASVEDEYDDGDSSEEDSLEQLRDVLRELTNRVGWGVAKFHVRRARRGAGWQGRATFTALEEVVTGARAATKKAALKNVIERTCRWALDEVKTTQR